MKLCLSLFFLCSVMLQVSAHDQGDSVDGYYRSLETVDCWNGTARTACKAEQGLNIQHRSKNSYYVWLHTEGNNGNFCSYQDIVYLEGRKLQSHDPKCKITVKILREGATVNAGEECNVYQGCGNNVSLNT